MTEPVASGLRQSRIVARATFRGDAHAEGEHSQANHAAVFIEIQDDARLDFFGFDNFCCLVEPEVERIVLVIDFQLHSVVYVARASASADSMISS